MVEEGMGWKSMPVFEWLDRTVSIYSGGGRWDVGVAVGVTAVAGISLAAIIIISSSRDGIKSPWSRRQRKRPLSRQQWDSFFTSDGTFHDGGMLFLKTVRSGGVEPTIRVEVWPFLLGVYELSSSETERSEIKTKNKREYKKLRQRCSKLLEQCADSSEQPKEIGEDSNKEGPIVQEDPDSPGSEHSSIARESLPILLEGITNSTEDLPKNQETSEAISSLVEENQSKGRSPVEKHSHVEDEQETMQTSSITEGNVEIDQECTKLASHKGDTNTPKRTTEDFETWQRIIRLDAIRANAEWVMYSRTQAAVPDDKAEQAARAVGLKDYDHLEPSRVYHAARLVALLEAYAIYDPEIGYCQGMSDLLSPILTVMEDDDEAFWCFVGFMKKARHNFRLDEVGIRRQLSFVSKIIKYKDVDLYRHLEKLQAEDCFFVYRMVVVLFRRELTFEQTVCLWEVMWADQAAIRAGIGKPVWGRTRLQAPPTDDLLLYAIAACVLQRRKLIIEKYSGMDEIIRECNNMAGQLDVWKLLDDAHDLVVTLHDKI